MVKKKQKSNVSGGSAAAGGMNFQANLTAIVSVQMLTGAPLHWLDGLTDDRPISVDAETGGPGDDIAIECENGARIEVQAKKGMRRGKTFNEAFDALVSGIGSGRIDFGILAVCPSSSGTIREACAKALIRIADGRADGASKEQRELKKRIEDLGFDPVSIASGLRIVTVSALTTQGEAIAAVKSSIGNLYGTDSAAGAWNALVADALRMIEFRGRRSISQLVGYLRATGFVPLAGQETTARLVSEMLEAGLTSTQSFEVLGISNPLSLDAAWIDLKVEVREISEFCDQDPEKVLSEYYSAGKQESSRLSSGISSTTVGQFRRHCVVVGGPGGGKSLLTKKLVRSFSKAGIPCVHVDLRKLAARMKTQGCGVLEGIFDLGLSATSLTAKKLLVSGLSDLALVCDGLDETGHYQRSIADGLNTYSQTHSSHRVVVTTRPIGYETSALSNWRHYTLIPPAADDLAENIETLVKAASPREDDELFDKIEAYIGPKSIRETVARTPLLIGFVASLFLKGTPASVTKIDLYEQIFDMIDKDTKPRKSGVDDVNSNVRIAVLNHLGWIAISNPTSNRKEMERICADRLANELEISPLKASGSVSRASAYWEEAGMIEPLSSGHNTLLAFIHKSCAEYAAARHLSELDEPTCRQFITNNFDSPAWSEVLDFSTRTGVAKILAEVSIDAAAKVDAPMNHVERGLYAVSKGLMDREDIRVIALVDSLINQLTSSQNRPRAFAIGGLLLRHPIERYPRILEVSEELCESPHRWQRLIGWALRLKSSSVDPYLVQSAYSDLLEDAKSPGYLMRPRDFFLGDRPDRDLLESFVGSALAQLVGTVDRDAFESLLSELRESDFDITMGLAIKLEGLLLGKRLGSLRKALFGDGFSRNMSLMNFRGNDAGSIRFEEDMIVAPFQDESAGAPSDQPVGDMLAMSALLTACGVWNGAAYEVRYWENAENLTDAQNTMRLAAKALGLSPERLRQDALAVRTAMETDDHYSRSIRVYAALPNVDPPEFDWTRLERSEVDLTAFEAGLHRGPNWLRYLFAYMIDTVLISDDERERLVLRLLKAGRGATLHLAAAFTQELAKERGSELIVKSLSKRVVYGSHYLFDDLARRGIEIGSSETIAALKAGLMSKSAEAAKAATLWAQGNFSIDPALGVPLLQDAFNHWTKTEDPYPKKGGAVPTSPREQLLELINTVEPLSPNTLLSHMSDDRPDVRKVAETAFLDCLKRDEALRRQVPAYYKDGSLSIPFLHALNRSDVQLDEEIWLGLISLLVKRGPDVRRAAIRFLADNLAQSFEVKEFISGLTSDPDADVREAAVSAFA